MHETCDGGTMKLGVGNGNDGAGPDEMLYVPSATGRSEHTGEMPCTVQKLSWHALVDVGQVTPAHGSEI